MADTYFGINLGDPEIDSSVQVGSSSNSTDVELRVTHTSGHVPTRLEIYRMVEAIRDYIVSGLNTTWPVN